MKIEIHDAKGKRIKVDAQGFHGHPAYRNVYVLPAGAWQFRLSICGVPFSRSTFATDLDAARVRDAFFAFVWKQAQVDPPDEIFVLEEPQRFRDEDIKGSPELVSLIGEFNDWVRCDSAFGDKVRKKLIRSKNGRIPFGSRRPRSRRNAVPPLYVPKGTFKPSWHDVEGNAVKGRHAYFRGVEFNSANDTYIAIFRTRGRPTLVRGFATDIRAAEAVDYIAMLRLWATDKLEPHHFDSSHPLCPFYFPEKARSIMESAARFYPNGAFDYPVEPPRWETAERMPVLAGVVGKIVDRAINLRENKVKTADKFDPQEDAKLERRHRRTLFGK